MMVTRVSQRGISIVLALFGIAMLAAFGTIFFAISTQSRDEAFREADRLRAAELASAGCEKALVILHDQHHKGNSTWRYPSQGALAVPQEELSGTIYTSGTDDKEPVAFGKYRIVEVSSYYLKKEDTLVGPYQALPYKIHGIPFGRYDILKVVTEGKINRTGVSIRLTTLVKVVRQDVLY